MRVLKLILSLAVLATLGIPSAPAADVEKSKDVKLLRTFKYKGAVDPFTGGTDITWKGRYVYAAQQDDRGGIHVIDAKRRVPRKIAFIPCPGTQNDVAMVKKGLLAVGYHNSTCAAPGKGVRLIDVRDPKEPKHLGKVELPGGTHTLTVYPGKEIIYASPGGLPTNGGAVEQILDVSNPRKPKVAATFKPNNSGCHDLVFDFTKKRKVAICAGLTETQVWDVSKPLKPKTISTIYNPAIFFHHSAAVSPDHKYLVLGDENFGANECRGGPTGVIWIYDFRDPSAPELVSYFGIDRGQYPVWSSEISRDNWCTAHLFNFIPGTRKLVSSWYGAGMNVIDLKDPANPTEIEHYAGLGINYWSAYWYRGRIWANDRGRGLDVFKVKGLRAKN